MKFKRYADKYFLMNSDPKEQIGELALEDGEWIFTQIDSDCGLSANDLVIIASKLIKLNKELKND